MWKRLHDIVTYVKYDDFGQPIQEEPNWLGIIILIGFFVMFWGNLKDFVYPDQSAILQSKLDHISDLARQRDLGNSEAAQELDVALSQDYKEAFKKQKLSNEALTIQLKKLKKEYEDAKSQCEGYPALLDRHLTK